VYASAEATAATAPRLRKTIWKMQQENPDIRNLFSDYMIPNPEEFAANLLKAYEHGSEALARLTERPNATSGPYSQASELSVATKTVSELLRNWLSDPAKLAEAQAHFFKLSAELWNNVTMRMFGMRIAPLIEPGPGDNRFKDSEWSSNPFFDFCKQAYLLGCKWAEDRLKETEGLSARDRHRAEFYLRQLTSAYFTYEFHGNQSRSVTRDIQV
jgi:polyhydroxyalkanoate synthase subunit PhaC